MMTPKTKDELWDWLNVILNVRLPRKSCCENHQSPFDAFSASYFVENSVIVWKASRGFGGKTYMLSALALTEQITKGAKVSLLGGSSQQSQNIHSYISGDDENAVGRFWGSDLAPRWLLKNDPAKKKSRTANGGFIKALTASQKSVRGPHPQKLIMDEVDEMDLEILDAAMGQPMGARGIKSQTTLSSTHQNPDGTMSEVLDRADRNDWPVYQWCYRETKKPHGWLDPSEIEEKQKNIASTMWKREYELEEPAPQDTAIQTDMIDVTFDARLGEYEGNNDEMITHRGPNNNRHFHGTDWAKSQDWTSITSFEDIPDRDYIILCAYLRIGRKPWPVMIQKHNERVERYEGHAYHDETGVGGVVDDYLTVNSQGIDFRKRSVISEMVNRYIGAIENGKIRYPKIDFVRKEHKTASNDMVFGSGHLPDSIASGALAYHAYHEMTHDKTDLVL